MSYRPIRTKTQALATAGIALAIAGPVWADCCDSFFDCAATVVTEGVSCEIQTILDTIRTIQTIVTNVTNDVSGKTQAAQADARQGVTDAYNALQSQSQQSSSDMGAALTQATTIYKTETQILATLPKAQLSNNNVSSPGGTPAAAPSAPPLTATLNTAHPATTNPTAAPPTTMTSVRSQSLTTASPAPAPSLQKSTVTGSTNVATDEVKLAAPHGAFADAFSRGVKEITTLKATGDQDQNTVNSYLAQAQASEGPGVAQANTVAGAMMAPLNALQSMFSSMLSNPLSAFDPSSLADQVESTVEANLSVNIQSMVDDISAGPNKAFSAAQPTYDDLLTKAERAQAIAAAMTQLYQTRTTAAANTLYALLPLTPVAGLNQASTVKVTVAGQFGQRLSFATVSAKMSTARQHALLLYKPPTVTPQLHAAMVQFKAQRAQGKSALPQSAMLAVRGTMSQQFDGYFKGKSPAAIASTRDQLIAQVRQKFATDPTTGNSVIALVTNEAASRGATSSASLTNPTIPGQPAPRVLTPTATMTPVTKVAAAPLATAPVATPTAAPTAAKAPSWGPAPAWTPGTTATPATTTKAAATTTLRSTQPLQQQSTPTTQPAAPSSLGR